MTYIRSCSLRGRNSIPVEDFYFDLDTEEGMDKYLDEVSDKITDKMLEEFR